MLNVMNVAGFMYIARGQYWKFSVILSVSQYTEYDIRLRHNSVHTHTLSNIYFYVMNWAVHHISALPPIYFYDAPSPRHQYSIGESFIKATYWQISVSFHKIPKLFRFHINLFLRKNNEFGIFDLCDTHNITKGSYALEGFKANFWDLYERWKSCRTIYLF